jgi:uncharacterized membrane protein
MSERPTLLQQVPDRIADVGALDDAGSLLSAVSTRTGIEKLAERGRKLFGHSTHPMLVDIPIGFWTSAGTLDLLRHRVPGSRRAAEMMVAAGVVTALPAVVSGLGELPGMDGRSRRVATVHAASNTIALVMFGASWAARRRGRSGARAAAAGAAVATVGGLLGGWLAFPPSSSEDHDA